MPVITIFCKLWWENCEFEANVVDFFFILRPYLIKTRPNSVSQWWNSCLAFIQPCVWSTAHTKINISRIYLYTYSPIICVASLFLYSLLPNRKLNYTEVEMRIIFLQRKTVFPLYNQEKLRIYNWRDSYHTYFMFKFYIWKSHLLMHCVSSVMQQFPLNWSIPSGREVGSS